MRQIPSKGSKVDPELGRRIKKARAKAGITQCELAEMLNMTEKQISNIERGLSEPHAEVLRQISDVLGVSTDSLLFDMVEDGPLIEAVLDVEKMPLDVQDQVALIINSYIEVQRSRNTKKFFVERDTTAQK